MICLLRDNPGARCFTWRPTGPATSPTAPAVVAAFIEAGADPNASGLGRFPETAALGRKQR
jgi:hypothetical protein